jgi:hypothetical protein
MVVQYADSENSAEKGPPNQSKGLAFRKDAPVWYLYLEDAEREASEKSDLWKTGLDSLLIFVSAHSEGSAGL